MSRQARRPAVDRAAELLSLLDPRPARPRRARRQPDHPLVDPVAQELLPAVSEWSAIDRVEHARGIARVLIAAYERETP